MAGKPSRSGRRGSLKTGVLLGLTLLFVSSGLLRLGSLPGAWATESAPPAAAGHDLGETCSLAPLEEALGRVRHRAEALDAREVAILERENATAISVDLISDQLANLEAAEARLQSLLALSDSAAETDLGRLTNVYETMDPDDAAALFSRMDPSFAAGFLGRMSAEAAAGVLAALEPDLAYSFSVLLATRNASAPRNGAGVGNTEN